MKKFKLFLVCASIVATLFFACKGTGKTGVGGGDANKNKDNPPVQQKEKVVIEFDATKVSCKKGSDSVVTGNSIDDGTELEFVAVVPNGQQVKDWKANDEVIQGEKNPKLKYKVDAKKAKDKAGKKTTIIAVAFEAKGNGGGGSSDPKDIEIDKIILGYPNISDRAGKTVLGKDLGTDATIPDFTVEDAKFPVQVYHKVEFTTEEVQVSVNGGAKSKLGSGISKTVLANDYTLVENAKTKFEVFITGEGFKPLKLTFNVTYIKPTKKYVDDLTNITITKNDVIPIKDVVYGSVGEPISKLKKSGAEIETIDISTATPKIKIIVNKGTGGQPSAEIKIDESSISENFASGQNKIEFNTQALTMGKHSVKIKITKEGYEAGEYSFNLVYKPRLTFKEMEINGTKYTDKADFQGKLLKIEATDENPVRFSGSVVEDGADVYFSKLESDNKYHKLSSGTLDLPQGKMESLRMYMKKDGYTTTFISFKLKRKEAPKQIVVKRIEVGDNVVENNGEVTVESEKATIKLTLTFEQKYEGITFKINDAPATATSGMDGLMATFASVQVDKDAKKVLNLKAEAQNYETWTGKITVTHQTPAQSSTEKYIVEASITPWDTDDGGFNFPETLTKDGDNWKLSLSAEGPHQFEVKITKNDKDISDDEKVKLFTLSIKNLTNNVDYLEKITGKKEGESNIVFKGNKISVTGQQPKDILLPTGENDLLVTVYYNNIQVEQCHFKVKR